MCAVIDLLKMSAFWQFTQIPEHHWPQICSFVC